MKPLSQTWRRWMIRSKPVLPMDKVAKNSPGYALAATMGIDHNGFPARPPLPPPKKNTFPPWLFATHSHMLRSRAIHVKVLALAIGVLFASLERTECVAADAAASGVRPVDAVAARISQFVQQGWAERNVVPSKVCSDREFVRRVYLDLAGRIPVVDEVDTFVADSRADKRRQLVYLLTESDDHAEHFADTFDALLMGRGTTAQYAERAKHGWRSYLVRSFRDNRPWNEVLREILVARPISQQERGSVWFLFERQDKHQQIAEAVAPAVFGIRIECAQCHDHPLASEIEQAHYWGLVAFFNRGKNVHTDNGPRVSESAIGGFSEFADLSGDSKPNQLTFLDSKAVDQTRPAKDAKEEDQDDLYRPASMEGDPRVPKFSRRERFADDVVASHPLVARAMVNRIWAMLMGRGIVHPLDEMDSVHPPSHDELLQWLARDFQESGFDVRRLVRAIALSLPYQLSSVRPVGSDDPSTFAWYLERPLTAEQLARSMQLAVRGEFRNDDPLVASVRSRIVDVMPDENVTSVKDALFLSNHDGVNQLVIPGNGPHHLVRRLMTIESRGDQMETLFQTIFARAPSDEEAQAIAEYIGDEPATAEHRFQQVLWSMLASAEFRFNH